jgi:hypothetical protein
MSLITGTTKHRLDLIKSYDPNNPYKIGTVKPGVTVNNVVYNPNGSLSYVEYNIEGISYTTYLDRFNEVEKVERKFINKSQYGEGVVETKIEKYPTTFSFTPTLIDDDDYYDFKNEAEMGVVFEPKIEEEIFIERHQENIIEKHSRLSEIRTMGKLETYRNGFYNIVNIE